MILCFMFNVSSLSLGKVQNLGLSEVNLGFSLYVPSTPGREGHDSCGIEGRGHDSCGIEE